MGIGPGTKKKMGEYEDYGTFKSEWESGFTFNPTPTEEAWRKAREEFVAADSMARSALPDITDKAVLAVRKRQALMVMQGRGRRSTFLTGPMGVPTEPVVARRTLLGGM